MKKIVIAGGTGFLGNALREYFEKQNVEVITLSRKQDANTVHWNAKELGVWTQHLEDADALINLAGKSVDCRYTEDNRKAILSSRVDSTRVLNAAMQKAIPKPTVFLNASTATIYAHAETRINTEKTGILGDDFSTGVAKVWEAEFFSVPIEGVRKVAMRTSIVLGNNGGAFPKMRTIAKIGMGGKQGRGNQFVSWIHIDDFCRAVKFLILSELSGSVNVTAPHPVRNTVFMKELSDQLKAPFRISQPTWVLEIGALLMGTETELLLKSRSVYPERMIQTGFKFQFEKVTETFKNLI